MVGAAWRCLRWVQAQLEDRWAPERSRVEQVRALWDLPVIRKQQPDRVLIDMAEYRAWSDRSRLQRSA